MNITVAERRGVTIISVIGAIDAADVETVSTVLDALVKEGRTRLVADASQLEYINSSGLRALVKTLKDTTRNNGDFRLANVQSNFRRVLEITGFTSAFKAYPDVEAAVASFSG
jgi:anti-sigma B factor antagonist